MNLSTARVFVNDLQAAKRFYEQTLGLPLKADGGAYGYCVFAAGNCELVIETVNADADADDVAMIGRFTGLSFRVDDIAATHASLQARGVSFASSPERQAWGGIIATLRDPAGNQLQIVQYPSAVG
jgi:predicted enzyme related to lactoylglutathione lyase